MIAALGRGAEKQEKAHPFYGTCHKVDFLEMGVLWIEDDEEDIQGIKKYRIKTTNFPKRKAHGLFWGLGLFAINASA